jgi:hypothetical protein
MSAIEYGIDWLSPSINRALNSDLPGVVPNNDKSDDSPKTHPKSTIICKTTCEPTPPNLLVTERARGAKIAINNPATTLNSPRSNIRAQYLTHGRTCGTVLVACASGLVSATGGRSVAPQFLQKISPASAGAAHCGQESFILACWCGFQPCRILHSKYEEVKASQATGQPGDNVVFRPCLERPRITPAICRRAYSALKASATAHPLCAEYHSWLWRRHSARVSLADAETRAGDSQLSPFQFSPLSSKSKFNILDSPRKRVPLRLSYETGASVTEIGVTYRNGCSLRGESR